jgi:hypothetical protein
MQISNTLQDKDKSIQSYWSDITMENELKHRTECDFHDRTMTDDHVLPWPSR